MFDRDTDYQTAVASYDDEGVGAAIDWCVEHMQTDDTLSVWTALQSNLSNCDALDRLVQRHSNVSHITGRGGGTPQGTGPVLMAWPDMDDIGKLVRYGHGTRHLRHHLERRPNPLVGHGDETGHSWRRLGLEDSLRRTRPDRHGGSEKPDAYGEPQQHDIGRL